MLRRLTIEDYGLIPAAQISFAPGATMFTGETGSGKTMVLGAIAFALGERSDAQMVRRGQTRAIVTLEFDAPDALRERLRVDGFALDRDEDATISRELTAQGKSSLRLNGRPATAAYVREIASEVVDIVGQHEAQRLLVPSYHMEMLDRFAGALELRERVAERYTAMQRLAKELESLDRGERSAREQDAYARYALAEIEAAAPAPAEDEALARRRRILDNAERIVVSLRAAHQTLAGEEGPANDALGAAAVALRAIASVGDDFAALADAAGALQSESSELAARLMRRLEEMEFDPAELEALNARLDVLESLKRKYGGSIDAVLDSARSFRAATHGYEDADDRKRDLHARLVAQRERLAEAAQTLSSARLDAASRLQKRIEQELRDLALPSARFRVSFETLREVERTGAERVEFLFAANKGDVERPLGRIASGGELSRVLLALVVVLARARGSAALVFDEIDAGVGGATAAAVGVRLGRLARDAQVICVTHLAQIASWADDHYVLEKREDRSAATIGLKALTGEKERVSEVARMLSGETHDAALKHARVLLRQSTERQL